VILILSLFGLHIAHTQSAQGTWSYDRAAREVTFSLGYVGLSSNPSLSVTVMPVAAGTLTNALGVVFDRQYVNPIRVLTDVTEVLPEPDLTPSLGIRLISPTQHEPHLSGAANVAYQVEISPDVAA
jgi:hypothetical protein